MQAPARICVQASFVGRVEPGARAMRVMRGTVADPRVKSRRVALTMGACACALTLGLSGCVFTTPPRSEVVSERAESTLTADDLVSDGYLTVAMDMTDAPQAMTDADGGPSGYYADVARLLAERLGLDLKVVPTADAAGSIEEGEADLYIGSKAPEDDENISVSEPIVDDASSIFALAENGFGESPALDADSLAGATIAVQDNSAAQDALARGGVDTDLKTYENVNECFDALASGEVDYVACDATAGSYLSRAYPGSVFVATIGSVSSFGIALPSGDTNVSAAVEEVFGGLLEDGTLEAVHRAWYGSLPFDLSDTRLSGLADVSDGADAPAADITGSGNVAPAADDAAASESGDFGELTIEGDLNAIG